MFQTLTQSLNNALQTITGTGKLNEKNMRRALQDVRNSLIEADVALPVVKDFIATVTQKALGQKILQSVTPGQMLISIVQKELTALMGQQNTELALNTKPPAVILLAGLQGSGKTTTAVKLARFLQERHKKKVMLVSVDIYRPAAIQQLQILAQEFNILCHQTDSMEPLPRAQTAMEHAKTQVCDVLVVDTAGRLHIDVDMMEEAKALAKLLQPIETLFVVDSMTGQDAANTAKAFNDALPLTGVILTKIDGDARGGAALSIRAITGKNIKFLGTGEKTNALEPFYPDRLAARILGMGDVLSLIEEAEQKLDKPATQSMMKRVQRGQFTLNDFYQQLSSMQKLGGFANITSKLPGLNNLPTAALQQLGDSNILQDYQVIINSMTVEERLNPEIIKASRKNRIARGCGKQIIAVNKLLKHFEKMQKMVKQMSKPGSMQHLMRKMQGMFSGGGMSNLPF